MSNNSSSNGDARSGDGCDSCGGDHGGTGTIRYIAEVRPNDVLPWTECGAHRHYGNVQLRKLVSDRAWDYHQAGRKATKSEIIKSIAARVANSNGRFLRQVASSAEAQQLGVPKGVAAAWVLMDEAAVMVKIRSALYIFSKNTNSNVITEPRPTDILWPDSTAYDHHYGNVNFRTMVASHAADFRNSAFKKDIVKGIADSISYGNGRFLRKVSTREEVVQMGVPEGTTAWYIVDQGTVNTLIQEELQGYREDIVGTSSTSILPNSGIVAFVTPLDVLASFDTVRFDPYPSNVPFHKLLALENQAFSEAMTSKQEWQIAEKVVLRVSNRNGRFLVAQRLSHFGSNVWVRIENNTAIGMTLQALRSVVNRSSANGDTVGETPLALTPASQPTQTAVHPVTSELVNEKRARDSTSFAGIANAEQPRTKQQRILRESLTRPRPFEETVAAHPSTRGDTPLPLHNGPTDALDHDGDEMPTDHGAVMDENGDPADFGIEETANASDTNMDNYDVDLDSTSQLDKQEQALLQMSDVAYAKTLNGQESSHTTQDRDKAMGMTPSKSTASLLASNVNRADAPTFLPADTGRSQEDGSDSGSDGIQLEEAPIGQLMPASAQNDAPSAEDLEPNDEGLNFCLSRMRSIGVRNSRLLAKHSNLFNQLESLYTDPTIQSALPDDFVRKGRTFKIEQIPTPIQHEDGDDGDEGEQWLRWLACVVIQNARLRSTIEGQESKIQDLCEYKQQLDQAKSEADELQRQVAQLKTKTDACREAVVARLLAK